MAFFVRWHGGDVCMPLLALDSNGMHTNGFVPDVSYMLPVRMASLPIYGRSPTCIQHLYSMGCEKVKVS